MLQFDNIYYTYPNSVYCAINGLTMGIPVGKKSVILGRNGSGKSTLLFIADGLYRCSSGVVRWGEETLTYHHRTLGRWRQRIGLAFQNPEQQLVAGTVAEDISYGLCNLALPPREIAIRLEQAIIDFNLQELRDRPLHHLSLGQKRRVALAGVMTLQPQLLLLDEPTAYLDNLQTHHLLAELERIYCQGTTIVMATHDLNLAYAWGDWFFVLDAGQLVMEGEAKDIFSRRGILEELNLGIPLLWEVWEALSPHVSLRDSPPPKTVEELRRVLST